MKRSLYLSSIFIPLLIFLVAFNGLDRGLAQTHAVPALTFLPGDETIGAASVAQLAPAISPGGDISLVVWSDRRSSPAGVGSEYETANDIYAMRLDSAGNPLDSLPFVITQATANQDRPQAVWNGTHWLVVFESTGINGTGSYYEQSLAAVRVAPDGQVLDAKPIPIFNPVPNITTWSVASDGTDWVLVFQGSAASNDIQAVRILANGQVQQPAVSLLAETYYLRFHLHLAYAQGVFLLTWADSPDTLGLRFDTNLNLLDTTPFVVADNTAVSALTTNGSQFYVVYHKLQPDFSTVVTGVRVSPDGTLLDNPGVNISSDHQPATDTITSVTWDGINWQVAWGYNGAVSIARVSSDGQVLDPGGISIAGPETGVSAGDGTGGIHLVWTSFAYDQSDIVSAHISSNQVSTPNHTLSTGAPMQIYTDFAVGSNGYMAVYRSDTDSAHRIHVHPLDVNGNALTPEPIELQSGDTIYGPGQPSVSWNGSLYLVTWGNNSGIVAQRVLQDGTLVDASPFVVIAAGIGPTDVAAVGDTFLVVGRKYGTYPQYLYPVAARVRGSDGAVLDTPPLYVGESYARSVAVTAFGDRWLTVWFSAYTHDDSVGSTAGNFVSADGTLDTSFSIYGPYSMGGNGINEVSAASNGITALVLLSAEVTSGVETDLIGRLVNADGTTQSVLNLTPWVGNQYRAHAAWDGSQYVVAYTDQKNRFPQTIDPLDARGDLYGMRITENGAILDPQGFAFSSLPIAETHPNVVASDGVSLFAGSMMRNEAPYMAYRVGYTRLGTGGNQWPVAVAQSNVMGGNIPLDVQFSSTGSTDPDGTLAAYSWDFGDGSTSTGANPAHTYNTPGNYVVSLVVTDDGGATTTQTLPLTVTSPNQLPVTIASASPQSGQPPLDVVFSARGSYDPDGRLGNFHWIFSDGTDNWGPISYQTFYLPGIYTVTLVAYDDRGGSSTDTVTVYVGQTNQPPVAAAAAVPLNGNGPLNVSFNSAGSYDPDGTLAAYLWDFGDGNTSTQANPTHSYTSQGVYQAELTVTDNLGLTQSDSLTITVYGVALPPDQSAVSRPGESVTYTLMVDYTGGEPNATFDVNMNITGAQWLVDAPATIGPIPSGGSASLPVTVHVPAQAASGETSVVEITLTSQGGTGLVTTSLLTTRVANRIYLPLLLQLANP
jgi:PKD repeat protein